MSFFEELKRRNVFRVGIAYLVVAWLVMQVADVVINNVGAPGWVFQIIMLVLAIGFPLALIFAWAFEMTPDGLKKEKDVDRSQSITSATGRKLDRMIIGVLAVAVVYLLLDKLVLTPQEGSEPFSQQVVEQTANDGEKRALTPATPAQAKKNASVAVLPFVNMSGDADNEYFSDGLTETLLHMLANLPDLQVAARTSSFAFKGKNESIKTIANALGVANVLEGSVQKAGDRVRITAQLIRADDGFHVWSQHYDRTLDDIFAIQDEIAGDVASALGTSLLGNEVTDLHAVDTTDLDAYDDYLKGLQQQAIFSYSSLDEAENHFKKALAHDPDFDDARLALARNYLMKNGTGLLKDDELDSKVDPLISQVRERHPDNHLARALELAASMRVFDPGLSKEERLTQLNELRNLLPLVPTEVYIRELVAGRLNWFFKQPQEAVEVIQAGLLVDPLAADLYSTLGNIYRDQNQLDQAREALQRSQQLAPENPNTYALLALLEQDADNLPAALNWQRKAAEVDPQDHEIAGQIAEKFYSLELPEEGDRWFARVRALAPDSPWQHKLEVRRAVARMEFDQAIAMAQKVISAQTDDRDSAFWYPLFTYTRLMLDSGRAREAYDFLVSVRPDITNYAVLPDDIQGLLMQIFSIRMMTGFESFETRKQAWQQLIANFDARGFPWRDPRRGTLVDNYIITGDNQAAIDEFLNVRLNPPMARNLNLHKRQDTVFYAPLYDDSAVAARLVQLDRQFTQLRDKVADMLQEPEWNQ